MYWVIFGARQTYRYYEHYLASELRLERMERSFSQARLNALRMQLDPHFLFNALNTISSQVERDPRLARSMIEHLGDLLRLSLEARDRQEVPLAEEMAFLDHYVAIQKIRFGASLRIETQHRTRGEVCAGALPYRAAAGRECDPSRHLAPRFRRSRNGHRTARRRAARDSRDGRRRWTAAGMDARRFNGLGLSVTRERISGLHPNGNSRFTVMRRERRRDRGGDFIAAAIDRREADDRSAR